MRNDTPLDKDLFFVDIEKIVILLRTIRKPAQSAADRLASVRNGRSYKANVLERVTQLLTKRVLGQNLARAHVSSDVRTLTRILRAVDARDALPMRAMAALDGSKASDR